MTRPTVLVTGITGLVGVEVAAALAREGYAVIGLTHARTELLRNDGRRYRHVAADEQPESGRITLVQGDVTQPQLGLSGERCAALRDATDLVVHCAATTDIGRSAAVYESLNVGGARNVLAFLGSRSAERLPLVHVSTAYVCGERVGHVTEDDLEAGQRFGTGYEESKCRAEIMVRQEMEHGLAAVIVRPSVIVGTQRSGVIREFKSIYVVLKMFTEGRVRSIPGLYEAKVDLVPIDYVTQVILESVLRFDEAVGQTFHAVGKQPHTLRDISDVLAEYPSFHVPRYVPPTSFDRAALTPTERLYWDRVVGLYESYFRRRMTFTADRAEAFVGCRPTTHGLPLLRKLLDYCLRVNYLGAPVTPVQDVVARLGNDARPERIASGA